MRTNPENRAPAYQVDEMVRRAIQERVGISRDEFVEAGYGFIRTVAAKLGFPEDFGQGDRRDQHDWDRLAGQVKRSLDKLADDQSVQLVIRVKPSERAPDGTKPRWTRYYIPEKYAELAEERARKHAQHQEIRARWDNVTRKLSRVIGPCSTDHLGRPMLSLRQWDEILESLVADPGQEG